jgi:hypothetical protein
VTRRLSHLKCVGRDADHGGFVWLYQAEAAPLVFFVGWDAVPAEKQPLVLGRLHFPSNREMTLQVNSIPRALAAARYFAPHLGDQVVLQRGRVVNRCFAARDGTMDELLGLLDQNVTVIDPEQTVRELTAVLRSLPRTGDLEQRASELLEQRLNKDDVPLVEDFPLWPEEETPNFDRLSFLLQVRLVRAVEHWKGNTELTLTKLITRLTETAAAKRK